MNDNHPTFRYPFLLTPHTMTRKPHDVQATTLSKRQFLIGTLLLCLIYLAFECYFNANIMLTADEFWFAHTAYLYQSHLPYRDFAPYKTVLGYYLLLLPMLVSHGLYQTLITIKNTIALLNTIILFISSLWLSHYFSRISTLIALSLLTTTVLFLTYSTNIRVDLFAYWFCLFSLLLLLDKRFWLAGCFIGLGFITSQKAAWYLLASNGALGISWLAITRDRKTFGQIILFNVSACLMIGLYIAIWSWASSVHAVLSNMFSDASAMYHLNWYGKYRLYFWKSALQVNFLFFLLSPVACISLISPDMNDIHYQRRLFVTVYTFIILLCLLTYQQIFIYNMLAAAPALLVFYAAFFQWLITLFQSKQDTSLHLGRQFILYLFVIAYLVTLLYLSQILDLPLFYPLLFIAPLILAYYMSHPSSITPELKSILSSTILVIIVFIGLFYPLNQFFSYLPIISNAYQQANIRVANALLQDGSGYIAGTDLIYDRNQTISGLRNLVAPTIAYLKAPSAELRSVMFTSLDQDPNATTDSIIQDLSHSSVKFYVDNYRMLELPIDIKNYLNTHYQHFWGSIYLYAPQVQQGETSVFIPFSGRYLIDTKVANAISLNGQIYQTQSVINLKKGYYQSNAKIVYRLKLVPEGVEPLLKAAFAKNHWAKIIY